MSLQLGLLSPVTILALPPDLDQRVTTSRHEPDQSEISIYHVNQSEASIYLFSVVPRAGAQLTALQPMVWALLIFSLSQVLLAE